MCEKVLKKREVLLFGRKEEVQHKTRNAPGVTLVFGCNARKRPRGGRIILISAVKFQMLRYWPYLPTVVQTDTHHHTLASHRTDATSSTASEEPTDPESTHVCAL